MDKEQAKKEYDKIISEVVRQHDNVIEKGKKDGTWKRGTNSNSELFRDIDDEARQKIELLKAIIDGEGM